MFVDRKSNLHSSMKSKTSSNLLIIFALSAIIALASCNIEEIVYDENPFIKTRNVLNFKELQISNQSINWTDSLVLKAVATGDSLHFEWGSSGGTLSIIDSIAIFYPDTTGIYTISCIAFDKYANTATKSAEILVAMELIFNGISAGDSILPPNMTTQLRAMASGEELQYTWTVSGGTLTGADNTMEFTADAIGSFTISCKVSDKYGESLQSEISLEVTNQLIFKKLEATKTQLEPYEVSIITAKAYGQDLKYKWHAEPMGVLLGYFETVNFSNCHGDVYNVSCQISDAFGNTETKYITITITD
jgi:hypothetical protein